ncbi:hypothetical protein EDB83DRAFT_2433807, partial [Lactarius deliciosus]
MPMTSSSSSLSSSVAREGCTPSNPRTGELGSSPSLSGLRLPPPPSTDGSIVPLPAYSPTPVSVLAPAPPKTFPACHSIDPSPPRFGEARLKLRPWVGLVRARPTSTPAPGLWSTPSCSGTTKPSMGLSGWPWVPAVRSSGGGGCGGTTSSSTPCASAGPASRSI